MKATKSAPSLVVAIVIASSIIGHLTALAPLTAAQLVKLISIGTPDHIVAAEVTERGLKETIDKALVDLVRKAGAGPATLNALEKIRPRATLTIRGLTGTRILVPGLTDGRIGDGGALILKDLWPGKYEVTADLFEHTPEKQMVSLQANAAVDLEMRLKSSYGFLSISTNSTRATINVEGVSRFRNNVSKHRLRAGSYTVKIESPYHNSHSETVEIQGGDTVERQITLTADARQLEDLLARVQQKYSNRDYRGAASDATDYLGVTADTDRDGRRTALTNLSLARFQTREYDEAAAAGRRALALGGSFSLNVTHHHASGFFEPHQATLNVSPYRFDYNPVSECNFTKGSTDSARVAVTFDRNARLAMSGGSRTILTALQVRLPKPNKPAEFYTLNFIDDDADRLHAIYRLVLAATTIRESASSSGPVDQTGIVGKYVRVGGPSDYLELKADGTFFVQQQGKSAAGTFAVNGNVVTLRMAQRSETGRIEGTRIVDPQGDVWEKVPGVGPADKK